MTSALVVGTPGSGKSAHAEELAVRFAGNGPKIYVATMIPYGEEGAKRVERHRKLREGKGFETIEKPTAVDELAPALDDRPGASCLLECAANLAANEAYDPKNKKLTRDELAALVVKEIEALIPRCAAMTIVTNEFPLDAPGYDDSTREYAALMRGVNAALAKIVDRVDTVVDGVWRTDDKTR